MGHSFLPTFLKVDFHHGPSWLYTSIAENNSHLVSGATQLCHNRSMAPDYFHLKPTGVIIYVSAPPRSLHPLLNLLVSLG
ncbi:hypothetical protein GDO81_025383 [Engystomops pustulosus]|uniref:Uncharacterized protein n=1 Tax=Engystomops pustulosus TaxID=76066 RepID=A0AAV6ZNH6_ENGPU|nr:hypothetical protein GDO81_025383 [Engystomops pustulosus]